MNKTLRKCDDDTINAAGKLVRCRRNAVTSRKQWHFSKDNKAVSFTLHLCASCAEMYDECQAEAEWEARVS